MRFFLNQNAGGHEIEEREDKKSPFQFHQRLPGYAATPLLDAPQLAQELGIKQLLLKDESSRLGLPAFKILGASWAIYRVLQERNGCSFEPWQTLDELIQRLVPLRPLTLVTATDGNHGRAVAHVAALFGLDAKIYVPAGTNQARIDGIASEGAQVEIVHGTYDDAVARAAQDANERCLVISDTSWPGYEKIPRWVAAGYSTIFAEIDDELARRGEKAPDLVAIQFGVGALAAALVRHAWRGARPRILGVEPLRAACGLESMRQDEIITVPGPHDSIMAGLNCGRPSLVAWPIVARGIDAFIAVSDNRACEAMRSLQKVGVVAGETGAAGLAGLLALLHGPKDHRTALGIGRESRALLLITEGATDPDSYQRIVGHRPRERTASRPAAR